MAAQRKVNHTEPVPACFKSYDVRGRVPDELDEGLVWKIGKAYGHLFDARNVVIGHDVRLSSPPLSEALADGLRAAGATVHDLGLCGTEEVYFATVHLGMDGGIMVTASHNPAEYNGLKFVRSGGRPVGLTTGLAEIAAYAARARVAGAVATGGYRRISLRDAYVRKILSFVDPAAIAPFSVVVNAGNGCAGPIVDLLAHHLPLELTRIAHEPNGNFTNGGANPLAPATRAKTAAAVTRTGAQLGVAWDGDFDRCCFFDENGRYVDGYYIVGLLAGVMLRKNPGGTVVHDPRLVWNTVDVVTSAGGIPAMSRCGHSNIKDMMRTANGIYGGEMSGHHYFREFAHCDSGMIPWLMVMELMSRTGKPLSELVAERQALFPASGEINHAVADPEATTHRVASEFLGCDARIQYFDGVSIESEAWRFNLRPSNTEPLIRLNVEARADREAMHRLTEFVQGLLAE